MVASPFVEITKDRYSRPVRIPIDTRMKMKTSPALVNK